MGHARAIINIDDVDTQLSLFKRIVDEDWSVRRVEEEVRKIQNPELADAKTKKVPLKQEIRSIQFRLSSFFGSKVSIKSDEKDKGEIRIPFTNQEDLERIISTLGELS